MADSLKMGICGICDVTPLFEKKGTRTVFSPEYCEFSFVLSNGLLYRHGICSKCIVDLTQEKVEALIQRIKRNWEDELVGVGTDLQFKHIRTLEYKTHDISEKKCEEKYKAVKAKEHKDKIAKGK
jgi:hypothetical protein